MCEPILIESEGQEYAVEYVIRMDARPLQWPVCSWDGAMGESITRTLDGAHWFRKATGYYSPQPWEKIATPRVQPPCQ